MYAFIAYFLNSFVKLFLTIPKLMLTSYNQGALKTSRKILKILNK